MNKKIERLITAGMIAGLVAVFFYTKSLMVLNQETVQLHDMTIVPTKRDFKPENKMD